MDALHHRRGHIVERARYRTQGEEQEHQDSPLALLWVLAIITDVHCPGAVDWQHCIQCCHGCLTNNLKGFIVAGNKHSDMVWQGCLQSNTHMWSVLCAHVTWPTYETAHKTT